MRPYLVQYTDTRGPVSVWIEAESPQQIASVFENVDIAQPQPEWATDELMAEFGAYKLNEMDEMPEELRRLRRP